MALYACTTETAGGFNDWRLPTEAELLTILDYAIYWPTTSIPGVLLEVPPLPYFTATPGVAAGAVFVFVLSIGNFVTPDLLGGGKFQMVGNLIYDQFLSARDWPFGAALSALLIALMMLLLFAQAIFSLRARGDYARA